jgi:hypothetical protein
LLCKRFRVQPRGTTFGTGLMGYIGSARSGAVLVARGARK